MGRDIVCRICETTKSPHFANLFDVKVPVYESKSFKISYFDAMQQLTGIEIDYGAGVSNNICTNCQDRVELAYKIRGDLITALERKTKRSIKVIKVITSHANEPKNLDDGSVLHEELVEITEVDEDYGSETENIEDDVLRDDSNGKDESNNSKTVTEEVIYLNDPELITDDVIVDHTDGEPLDAVSFLLEKKDLFKSDKSINKSSRRSHTCTVCEKKFMRKSNLVDHLRLHAKIRPFKCEYCNKEFVQAGNYRSHLRIHTKERPYKCSMCTKTYNQSSALKVHIRSHTNEKNYICRTCDKGFTNSSDLNKHMRVHDPSLKIKCEQCDKTFAQRVNLKNHIARHHSNTNSNSKTTKSNNKAKK